MKKLITLKGMGGLIVVLTALSPQVAHAGDYGPPAKRNVTGNGSALADAIGDGHVLTGVTNPALPPGNYTVTQSKSFPVNTSTVEYTFTWMPDNDNDTPTARRAMGKFTATGGSLRGSHTLDGERSLASATLSHGGDLSVDSLIMNPDDAYPPTGTQTVNLGVHTGTQAGGIGGAPGETTIVISVSVSASGESTLTAVRNGSARTDFRSLKVTSQSVELVLITNPGPRG